MAGDFSPLTIDASNGTARLAPPAMLIAAAVGLGSIDMPIPQVATWEWVSWKFPKAVRAGETIYARWTLTQKRPPVHGAKTGIVVWRVDVHTADGAMCAEGEIGAAVTRRSTGAAPPASERGEGGAAAAGGGTTRRRRRRRTPGGEAPSAPAPPPAAPAPAAVAATDRAPRRRRRGKRGSGSGANGNNGGNGGDHPVQKANAAPAPAPAAAPAPTVASPTQAADSKGALSRVMRRLRRT